MSKPPYLEISPAMVPVANQYADGGSAVYELSVYNRKNIGRRLDFRLAVVRDPAADARPVPATFPRLALESTATFQLARRQRDMSPKPVDFGDPLLQGGETHATVQINAYLESDLVSNDPQVLADGLGENYGLVVSSPFEVVP